MAKFYGEIGYSKTVQTSPGVWGSEIEIKKYYGEVNKNSRRLNSSGEVNDDISVSVEISIIADPYANENFHSISYVKFMGQKWKVTNVDVQSPRLILTLGGLYNGQ